MYLSRAEKFWAFLLAVAIHVLAAMLIVFSISFSTPVAVAPQPSTPIMNAVAVDQSRIDSEVQKLRDAERRKREDEQRRQRELEQKAEEAQKKREAEEQRLTQLQKEQNQVQKNKEQEKQRSEEERLRIEEEKRIALEEKQKAIEEKQKAEEEKKRIEEENKQAAAEKQRLEEEKQKALEEKRQREEEARKEKERLAEEERQKELQQAMAEEENRRLEEEAQQVLAGYSTDILADRVGSLFINPGPGKKLKCVLFVRIDRTGVVQDVQLVESSGSKAFDRQAEIAVRKASPLPLPETNNAKVLDLILQGFNFEFVPEG